MAADNATAEKGTPPLTLAEVSVEYIKSKFGAAKGKRLKQKLKIFALALDKCNTPGGKEHSDWLWLFSRLAGCYTASGRVLAVPDAGTQQIVD